MPGLNLTQVEAAERSQNVNPSSYQVELNLNTGEETFRSKTTIEFSATDGTSTFVDLVAARIHEITLNGTPLPAQSYVDNRILLSDLAHENTLEVDADCFYMHTGEGLHSFVDPADGLRYCYSQFEVPDARRVFATFEQPDLKATFQFSVTTPESWTVLSNSATPVPEVTESGLRFEFAATPVISTYITAIIAGPYVGKLGSLTSIDGREIPLGVYCRQSLEEYLDADAIMDTTRKGFAFFEDAYGIPYPFDKYDQIFVPEYNAGAMENAGCVTYRDQYIFRSKPTAWELETRANTILHELAHMWFGDLVTMQWWNDLWLNESFAEYMSHLALAEGTEWKDAWIGFMSRKEWGMNQDQLPSTHPVKADMPDLHAVEVNFDGITYAKGASVLRQLVTYVGRENFFAGLHQYLTKHAWGNATLEDLLSELEATSGRDLSAWSKVWLEEEGVTTLRPGLIIGKDGTIERLSVVQEVFTPGSSLRPHRLAVAGYDLQQDGTVKQSFQIELDVDGAETVVEKAAGLPLPDLLLVNDGDLAYAKVRLDPQSLAFATENIGSIDSAVTRRTILSAAWDMVRDAELPATEYIELALRAAAKETNTSTLTSILQRVEYAVTHYTAPENRAERMGAAAERLLFLARTLPAGTDAQALAVRSLARGATQEDQYAALEALYTGTDTLHGLDVDVDLQWKLLTALVRGGKAGPGEIAEQLQRDPTLTGEQNAARARATIDSDTGRQETWHSALFDSSIPNDTVWAMLEGFWAHATTEPLKYLRYVEEYFDDVVRLWEKHTFQMASRLIETAFPLLLSGYLPEVDVVGRAQEWQDAHQGVSPALVRMIVEGQADAARMIAAQQRDLLG